MTGLTKRTMLRGAVGGAAVAVGLPFLDCFLNGNGTALATGQTLPPVFGTWFQHLGLNPGMWAPKTVGPDYANNLQLKVLDPYRNRVNIFSGLKYFIDGRPVETHITGPQIVTTGAIAAGGVTPASLDTIIAEAIGPRTRFRSLEVSLSGTRASLSKRAGSGSNPSEGSPARLYTRIFGSGFTDPNAAGFTPDPVAMTRKSVLSYVGEQRKDFLARLGTSDRARLDEYFTSLRQIEQQVALELEKPAPLASCTVPGSEQEAPPGATLEVAGPNNKLLAGLLAHAIACDQTRVFNVLVNSLDLRRAGNSMTWHMVTHEEQIDEKAGYQLESFRFTNWAIAAFADLLKSLDSIREGSGTVLDRAVVMWMTDHSDARMHGIDNVPVFTAGTAGGRLKGGLHVALAGDPATRVGLTLQQALGVPVNGWGERSNYTTKTISEILA
ncbi:MAG: DUF1552 domain-containing protein [Rhodospirillaceae bacterium]